MQMFNHQSKTVKYYNPFIFINCLHLGKHCQTFIANHVIYR